MTKKRNLLVVAILTIITLGIYSVYWLYATRKEIVAINHSPQSVPRVLMLFIPLIALLVLLPIIFVLALLLEDDAAQAVTPFLFFVCGILFFIAAVVVSVWWFYRYSEAMEGVTQESKEYYFVLWVVCFFLGVILVWMLIVQYHLNKLAAQPTSADGQNTLPPEPPAPEQTNNGPPPSQS